MSDLYYPLKVAGLTRQLPLCPISDDMMIGAFVIFGDTELTMACARELNKLVPGICKPGDVRTGRYKDESMF